MNIALIGSNGMLASMLKQKIPASYRVHEFDLPDFDITNSEQVNTVIGALHPDIIINCAAFTKVDLCETKQEAAAMVNGVGPGLLANAAHQVGAVLVHISTDFVFAGDKKSPYSEEDPAAPLSIYGCSKLKGEEAIINSPLEHYYIIRTSWLYGPGGPNFVETIARLACEREDLGIVADQRGTPTYTGDLAEAIMRLFPRLSPLVTDLPLPPYGLYHYSNQGECTWHEFACEIVDQLQKKGCAVKAKRIIPIATEDYPVPARRPQYSVLSKKKYMEATGAEVPEWKESLQTYFDNRA
ncbi:dTDP-4-dehydrorhamnose reductase [Pelovirga terrestris]|uniref:dTDP-4-dehydrorhamnose reductase n=1 Tax=Pelovirga terrestris TaxID=2771352 RepID=A0A8J6UHE1_9BACT|nr:dTDP-4-dehydrorhamnose reductase [Pelovirga terrestris]MBD1401308.1 dTDP-4-dehydrorhamnose reductase [Pelovirga terrestris]